MGTKTTFSCYICGHAIIGNVDRDHVVPECMFVKPLPNNINLLTLPAHHRCHNQLDEEYFRNALVAFCHDRNDTAKILWNGKIERSFARNGEIRRQARASLRKRVETFSPAGLYLRTDPGIQLNGKRFYKTPEKIFRGLYTHYRKDVLPRELDLPIYMAEPEKSRHPDLLSLFYTELPFLPLVSPNVSYLDVFDAWFVTATGIGFDIIDIQFRFYRNWLFRTK